MAFFNQPCTDCEIQGPLKKYPMVTGEEFTRAAMNRNFAALKAKREALEKRELWRSLGMLVWVGRLCRLALESWLEKSIHVASGTG